MIKFDQWWFPDGETSLPEQMAKVNCLIPGHDGIPRLTYQYHKYAVCLELIRQTQRSLELAVDVGAHIGLWAYWMCRDFEKVVTFEPSPHNRECLLENLPRLRNVVIDPVALGDKTGVRSLVFTRGASGGSHIAPVGWFADNVERTHVEVHRLDEYTIPSCSLLKIDVEGFELDVVRGATEFLTRTKPIIILETIPANAGRYNYDIMDAVHHIEALGGYVHVRMGFHDLIMGWRD